jgi:hypothetical protein
MQLWPDTKSTEQKPDVLLKQTSWEFWLQSYKKFEGNPISVVELNLNIK